MKRYLIASAIFLVGVGLLGVADVEAQNNSDNDDINVNTTVLTDLTVTKNNDVNFGEVFTGVIPTLDPRSDGSNSDVGQSGTSAQVGDFQISGSDAVSVNLSFSATQPSLTDGDGTDIQYNVWLVGSSTSGQPQTNNAQTVFDYTTSTPTTNPDVTLNGSGNYYLFLGGTLTATGDVTASLPNGADGSYSTTLTLTATYN